MSADIDVAAAVLAKWNATAAITTAVPGGIHEDRLISPQTQPYCRLRVRQDPEKRPEPCGLAKKGLPYFDYRRVTFEVYSPGKAGQVSPAIDAIKAAFNEDQPLAVGNANWLRTEMLPDEVDQPEDKTKAGQDVYDGKVEYRVWSQRTY